jgi:hypothetical protein
VNCVAINVIAFNAVAVNMFLDVIFHVYVVPRRSCQLQHVHCNYELHLSYATQILAILVVTKTTYGGSESRRTIYPHRFSGK